MSSKDNDWNHTEGTLNKKKKTLLFLNNLF